MQIESQPLPGAPGTRHGFALQCVESQHVQMIRQSLNCRCRPQIFRVQPGIRVQVSGDLSWRNEQSKRTKGIRPECLADQVVKCTPFVEAGDVASSLNPSQSTFPGPTGEMVRRDRHADQIQPRHVETTGTIRPSTTRRDPLCRPIRQFRRSGMSTIRSTPSPVSGPSPTGHRARCLSPSPGSAQSA